ncbi:MAG: integrase arm-type DNA-binding domain-containing protein [Roseitalea porphyridii]|uniref:tyrosine-type recombinase/integrase n=1 Tax=Roseitalea porphyridii TaxID=1852022 RepID=UPI0032EE9DC7
MPAKAKELTALQVSRLQHAGNGKNKTYAVGGVDGLLLQITKNGGRSWVLRATVGNKRRRIGLGSYPTVPLAMARERARQAHDAILNGVDPVEDRKAKRTALIAAQKRNLTFAEAMEKYLAGKLEEFKDEKFRKQWRSSLDRFAVPVIGDMAINDLDVDDVKRVLEPIWLTKNVTATRLRGRMEGVFAWAKVGGYYKGDNPAKWSGNLDAILPKPGAVAKSKNFAALKIDDAADWFADVRSRDGTATRALEFLAMTACRSGEVRGAVWSEIDFEKKVWTIPAERMKARRDHRVPLTAEMVALLEKLPRFEGVDYVFPAVRGGMLSDMAISACMRRINEARDGGYVDARTGKAAVPHGLRSTFRDWAAERTSYPAEMAELALAHNVGNAVERAYRRTDLFEKRRQLMADWTAFLHG